MYWCQHVNPLMRKCAFPALDQFFCVVSQELLGTQRREQANRDSFTFFVRVVRVVAVDHQRASR